ncbi:hypothetical protein [Streptomyces sp. NPDC006552]|uniref:hypothetical protein n=1 Tax=Streptomyces sp. NPDC006552 TaxID=3157179 RepID=UPI0033ADAD40
MHEGAVPGRQDGSVAGRDPSQDPLAPGAGRPGAAPRHETREQPPAPGTGVPAGTDPLAAPVPEGTGHHRDTGVQPGHGDAGFAGDTGGAGLHRDPDRTDATGLHGTGGRHGETGHHDGSGPHGPGGTREAHGPNSALVAPDTREDLEGRLKHAVAGFVDQPRAAVEEADHVLEDLTAKLTETLAGRRRTLRTSWEESEEDTERLRLALRDYRETAERLLSL